ncbi:MAG: DMT family transporter [Clostridiales bacterium]|nr:DMT family transporter [Clostridiales bacterium]
MGDLAILAAAIIWGSSFIIMKDTLSSVPTFYLLAIRFIPASVILALIGIRELRRINLTYIKYGVISGLLLIMAYVLQTLGLNATTPGKNAFLTTVYCIIVPFLYWLFTKRKPDKHNVIAAWLSLIGIGLISLDRDLSMNYGDILTLFGGFFFACHIVALAKATKECGVLLLTMIQFITAGIVALIGGMIFETFPTAIPASAVTGLLYLSVMATALCLLLQSIGQKYTHPSSAAVLLTLESVFGAALSVLLGRDKPSVRLFAGFTVMFISVLITETKLSFLKKKNKI